MGKLTLHERCRWGPDMTSWLISDCHDGLTQKSEGDLASQPGDYMLIIRRYVAQVCTPSIRYYLFAYTVRGQECNYTTGWLYIASFVSYNSYRDCWKTLPLLKHVTVRIDYNQFNDGQMTLVWVSTQGRQLRPW